MCGKKVSFPVVEFLKGCCNDYRLQTYLLQAAFETNPCPCLLITLGKEHLFFWREEAWECSNCCTSPGKEKKRNLWRRKCFRRKIFQNIKVGDEGAPHLWSQLNYQY